MDTSKLHLNSVYVTLLNAQKAKCYLTQHPCSQSWLLKCSLEHMILAGDEKPCQIFDECLILCVCVLNQPEAVCLLIISL